MSKNRTKKLNKQASINNEKLVKGLRVFLIVATAVILFYPPYLQGLFFEKHILPTAIFVFSVFIIFCIYKLIKKDYTFFKTPIEYIALGFAIIYLISIIVAVHTRSAIIELLKYCMYFAVFYMVSDLAADIKTRFLFLWTIVVSAVGVSIIGLDSAIGGNLVRVLNKFFGSIFGNGPMFFGLFVYNRINSTLQYPNALAAYVMAVYFITIGLLLAERQVWKKALCGAFAFILFLTFMLTESRGAQLVFPIAFFFYVLVTAKGNRIKAALNGIILAIPAAIVSIIVSPHLSEKTFSKKAFGFMVAGLIMTAGLSVVLKYIGDFLQKISWKVYAVLAVILAIVLPIAANSVLHASVPVHLSHGIEENNSSKSVSRDVALTPGKEFILSYNAETKMHQEQPYAYYVNVSSKNRHNILFGGNTRILQQRFNEVSEYAENNIEFTVPDDSNLITITFVNYYSGTEAVIDNVRLIDPETGDTVKRITLKNKYGLEDIASRLSTLKYDRNGLTRLIYYIDGFNIFKNHWLLGKGGGAWEYLYRQYQSFNYSSTQAHNFPLQLGIETGILGILLLIILIYVLLFIYSKYYKKHNIVSGKELAEKSIPTAHISSAVAASIAALFMHSMIDFDFSESAMLLLFWQLIAIFNSEVRGSLDFREMLPFQIQTKTKSKKHRYNKGPFGSGASSKAIVYGCIIIAAIALISASSFQMAATYAAKAYEYKKDNELDKAIDSINKAIELDGYNEKYVIGFNPVVIQQDIKSGLAELLLEKNRQIKNREQNGEQITQTELSSFQRQVANLNQKIKKFEKNAANNLHLTTNLASYCFATGQTEKGIEYIEKSIALYPFEPTLWQSRAEVYYQLANKYINEQDYENAEKCLASGLEIIDKAREVNERNLNPFIFNEHTVNLLQKMQYMKDYWDDDDIQDINKIIHYTIPYMDINMDNTPDQWRCSNADNIKTFITDAGIRIQVQATGYIYTQYPLKLERGRTYSIEIITDTPVETISYEISGIAKKTALEKPEEKKFVSEFLVENDPNKDGNQLRLHLDADCVIKSIIVGEIQK